MENLKKIEAVKGALVFEPKGNEIVARLNIPWKVKIEPEGLVDTAVVQYGDNEIVIAVTFRTMKFYACDETGAQVLVTVPAFIETENE